MVLDTKFTLLRIMFTSLQIQFTDKIQIRRQSFVENQRNQICAELNQFSTNQVFSSHCNRNKIRREIKFLLFGIMLEQKITENDRELT